MAYRADIEIAVRGAQELKRLQDQVSATSKLIDGLNNYLSNIGGGGVVRSINNLNAAVADTAAAFNKAALGTEEATLAARNFVSANSNLTRSLEERLALLKSITEQERRQRLGAAGIRETTQYAEPIGPGQASPVALSSPLRGRTQQILDERQGRTQLTKVLEGQAEAERQLQNSKLDEKAARVQAALDGQQAAAAESANQIQKLTERQAEFTTRTNAAARAAAGQTAEFYRQARIAKEVAKLNAAAPAAQLLLAPAAPGAPAMSGGARRRITGSVERLGGARTDDEAQRALRLAQGVKEQVRPLSQIESLYAGIAGEAAKLSRIKALPSSEMLNAAARGLQTIDSIEERRVTRARRVGNKLQQIRNYNGDTGMANAGFGMQGPAVPPRGVPRRSGSGRGGGSGGRLGGAISGSIIGGSFPLLFGQGAGAAAGGAIGGLAGGLLGPGGSFAGSLLGTLLGDIASKGQQVKELATDIGFTAEQTKRLQAAFTLAGRESDKFIESVQNIRGLSLSLDDQADSIQLVSKLTEVYGGKIEKVTNAFTSALESGKVTQATLNQLTSQGIPIQDELAKKYGVSRDKLLQMAKDGKISVQELVDVLVDMGNKGVAETGKTESGFEKLKKSVDSLGSALADLGGALVRIFEGPFNFILDGLARITSTAAESIKIISDLLKFSDPTKIETTAAIQAGRMPRGGKQSVIDVIGQDRLSQIEKAAGPAFSIPTPVGKLEAGTNVSKVLELLKQQPEFKVTETQIGKIDTPSQLPPSGTGSSGRKGPKPPEDRTAQLMDEYRAVEQRLSAENEIRDLLFEGKEARAADTEYAKALADIELERLNALRGANYAGEKEVINAMAVLKARGAELENEDARRAIAQQRFEEQLQMQEAVRSSVQAFKDMRTEQELQVQYGKTYSRLLTEGMLPAEAERLANFDKLIAGKLKENEIETGIVMLAIEKAKQEGNATAELEKRLKLLGLVKTAITGEAAAGPGAGPTNQERLQGEADRVRGELNTLVDPINMITNAAAGIGDAFGASFKGIIDGSMTAKEALGSFFKSVADMFLEMAAQIIAKQITMIILQTILKALGAVAGGGGGGANLTNVQATDFGFNPSAMTGSLTPGGLFAKGGTFSNSIVSSPTLFKFADGGTTKTGLMGEAGPEAIMPLKRGSDGSLGVQANGLREAMNQDRTGGTSGSPVLNMSFQSTSINGVEYVSRDQLEAAMAQTRREASRDGASRGMTMTLDKLQQSPTTRRRVGI